MRANCVALCGAPLTIHQFEDDLLPAWGVAVVISNGADVWAEAPADSAISAPGQGPWRQTPMLPSPPPASNGRPNADTHIELLLPSKAMLWQRTRARGEP